MKHLPCVCAVAATAVLSLAGCATALSDKPVTGAIEDDLARMAAIERVAQTHGVKVMWLNAPRKRVRSSDG